MHALSITSSYSIQTPLPPQRILEENASKLKDFVLGDKDFETLCELEHRQFIVNHAATVKKSVDMSSADLEAGQLIGVR
jgi:hypothetical protein